MKRKCYEKDFAGAPKIINEKTSTMSDNNTAIPKEILELINKTAFTETFKQGAIWGYQLRQQEVDELKTRASAMNGLREMWEESSKKLQSQLKAANETIDELRKELAEMEVEMQNKCGEMQERLDECEQYARDLSKGYEH